MILKRLTPVGGTPNPQNEKPIPRLSSCKKVETCAINTAGKPLPTARGKTCRRSCFFIDAIVPTEILLNEISNFP